MFIKVIILMKFMLKISDGRNYYIPFIFLAFNLSQGILNDQTVLNDEVFISLLQDL